MSASTLGLGVTNGGSGTIEAVSIGQLKVDLLYQRDLDATVVEKIAREYDIVTAGTIVVSLRDNGDMFIVDGQHRVAGATLAKETHMLAQIIEGLTEQEEAVLRLKGNYKKNDRIGEVFRARIFAQDPVALGIRDLLAEYDTRINFSPVAEHGF